jgi:hypothetical protein
VEICKAAFNYFHFEEECGKTLFFLCLKLIRSPSETTTSTQRQDYLERHKLLQYIQSMLHAVIQAKPHETCTKP